MKTGVALSGDGIKGAAAQGVLYALSDLSVNIDCISSTGSASLFAFLYACGVSFDLSRKAAQNILKYNSLGAFRYKLSRFFGKDRSVGNDYMEKRLSKQLTALHILSIDSLRKPLAITAIDLLSGRPAAFCKDMAAENSAVVVKDSFVPTAAIRSSMSHRGLLLPRIYFDMCLTDSGYRNLFTWPLFSMGASKIILVDLSDCCKTQKTDLLCKEADIYAQKLSANKSVKQISLSICDKKCKGNLSVDDVIDLGYRKTIEQKEKIYDFLYF